MHDAPYLLHRASAAMAAIDHLPAWAFIALMALIGLAFLLTGIVYRQAHELCLARRVVRWFRVSAFWFRRQEPEWVRRFQVRR